MTIKRWKCEKCGYCTDDYYDFEDHLCDEDVENVPKLILETPID